MTLDRTPLLAADGPPSLFDGVHTLEDDQDSPLAQLMRKKEPLGCQIDDERWESDVAALGNVSTRLLSEPSLPSPHRRHRDSEGNQQISVSPPLVSYITLLGGTLILLEWSFLWAAFLSESWFDLHLAVGFDWQKRFLPDTDGTTDTVLQKISLTELIQLVNSLESKSILIVVLVTTSILIPCGAMLIHPFAIADAHKMVFENVPIIIRERWFDVMVRSGFFVVFLFLIWDMTISAIKLHFTKTTMTLHNEIQSGFLSYILGLVMAICVTILMRWIDPFKDRDERSTTNSHGDTNYRNLMHQAFIFESSLLSAILFVVAFVIPLFQINYYGVGVEFMEEREIIVHFNDLGRALLTSEELTINFRTSCGVMLVAQVLILPVILWSCTVAYCCGYKSMKRILRVLHPTVNTSTLALTILLVLPRLSNLFRIFMDEQTSGICSQFTLILGEDCLSVSGKALWGSMALLGHAISLDMFVLLSLSS